MANQKHGAISHPRLDERIGIHAYPKSGNFDTFISINSASLFELCQFGVRTYANSFVKSWVRNRAMFLVRHSVGEHDEQFWVECPTRTHARSVMRVVLVP
jgi:hypothetical protein